MFYHRPLNLLEYDTVSINGKRHYRLPNGNFPSITTVLGTLENKELEEWKKRVGEKEANRISRVACSKGTNVHSLCESYLKNEVIQKSMPDALELFYSIRPELKRINNLLAQEKVLYSNELKVAGRVDCIGEFDGILSVVDFKTSNRLKQENHIQNYFLQSTFYALAVKEMTGIDVNQIVILIAVDSEKPQIFVKQIQEYIEPLKNIINQYHTNN